MQRVDAAGLLAAYDEQLRGRAEADAWAPADTDGPLVRAHYPIRGFVSYRSLAGVDGADLDALITRQIAHFAELGCGFEWKTRGHDLPADLPERLLAAGFVSEPRETVLVARSSDIAHDPVLPPGVALRRVSSAHDVHRIGAMESRVWGEDWGWLAEDLLERMAADPEDVMVLAVEAGAEVVSAAWLVINAGTDFAGLWGGSTLTEWRGRGIYRALVAHRAQLAAARGVTYLQVDASDDSRPILEHLGFVAITTTTPYIWTPPGAGTGVAPAP